MPGSLKTGIDSGCSKFYKEEHPMRYCNFDKDSVARLWGEGEFGF